MKGRLGPRDIKGRLGQTHKSSSFWTVLSPLQPGCLGGKLEQWLQAQECGHPGVSSPESLGDLMALCLIRKSHHTDLKWLPPNEQRCFN